MCCVMFRKKIFITGGLSLLFLMLTFWYEQRDNRENNLKYYASMVQKNLQIHENQIMELLQRFNDNPDFLERSDKFQAAVLNGNIQDLSNKPYTILLFEGEKLQAWSNNRAVVGTDKPEGFSLINEGFYSIFKQNLPKNYVAVCLIPIKWNYKLTNEEYLKNQFIASEKIPESVLITDKTTAFEITDKNGKSVFLDATGRASNLGHQTQLFLIVLAGLFFLCICLSNIAALIREKYGQGKSIFFFLGVAFIIKLAVTYYDFNAHFHLLPLFDYNINEKSLLNTSPSDILFDILIILWLIVYLYKDSQALDFDRLKFSHKIIINTILQGTMALGLLAVIYFHQSLSKDRTHHFDFENLFYIGFGGLITIMSLLMLWIVLFLFNYRIMTNIKKLNLPLVYRIGTLVSAMVLLFPMIVQYDFQVNYVIILVLIFAYIILNDFFIDNSRDSELTWTLLWLIFFSSVSTGLLYKYRRNMDIETLTSAIKKLSLGKDTKAIEHIDQLIDTYRLTNDSLHNYTNTQKTLSTLFKKDSYLFDNYRFILLDTLIKATSTKTRAINDESGLMTYTAQIPADSVHYYRLEVTKIDNPNSLTDEYKNSVWAEPYLGIKELDRMEYAVFRKGILVEQKGDRYAKIQEVDRIPKIGTAELIKSDFEYSEVSGQFENETVIVARYTYNGKDKIVSLFAHLFVLMSGITFFLSIINRSTKTIEDFTFARTVNMNTKVHTVMILLIVFTCIIVATVTFIYSNQSTENRHTEQLQQKLESVTSHIINEINRFPNEKPDISTLTTLLKSTHQIDVNFYDTNGVLFLKNEDIVFKKHLKAPLINSFAYDKLVYKGYSMVRIDDKIGDFKFQSGYARIEKDGELFALLEVPNYSREQLKEKDISNLMGTLISVYVLLLIPTLLLANSTAKIIMEPLKEVGRKLREVEFGIKPTKIDWDSKDELGELINEYNAMLAKLEESAHIIKENAQENAWRMMAKQVCHDIRNPLTPMNLTVQMMAMYAQTMSHDELKQYIAKSSRVIEEQIIHLEGLAKRFGEYAGEMTTTGAPKLLLETIDFCDFVELNASLFEHNDHPNTKLNIVILKEVIEVQIDKSQMARVLNNLIKNAIEAIPDHREGRVDVFVYRTSSERVQIRISDNGVGIPQEQMNKIFQPNFTTKGTGSGIGLAVSNRIVKDVDGKLWCESILGQGSDFFIELPIAGYNSTQV
jgi:two-component system, NtrC family, nitrogen regulation sensor histidine kinase NtrY